MSARFVDRYSADLLTLFAIFLTTNLAPGCGAKESRVDGDDDLDDTGSSDTEDTESGSDTGTDVSTDSETVVEIDTDLCGTEILTGNQYLSQDDNITQLDYIGGSSHSWDNDETATCE